MPASWSAVRWSRMSGPEPRLARRRLALEGEAPVVADAGLLGDQARGLEQLVAVRIARVEDPRGQRVRREDDMGVRSANAAGEELDEPRLVVPAVDERELGAARERLLQLVAVALDRHRRVVRGQHEPGDDLRAAGERRLGGIGDPRRPVLHPGEDRAARAPARARRASPR